MYIPSFVIRRGKSFSNKKCDFIDKYASHFAVPLLSCGYVNPEILANKYVCLEIGFGNGDHILEVLSRYRIKSSPYMIIGCETYLSGIYRVMNEVVNFVGDDVKLWLHDARFLLEKLPHYCLMEVFILFPDPWPKNRHKKRRLINYDFLSLLLPKIAKGGKLIIATDHCDYAKEICNVFKKYFDVNNTTSIHNFTINQFKLNHIEECSNLNICTSYAKKACAAKRLPIHYFNVEVKSQQM